MKGAIRKGRKPGTWELRVSLGVDPLTGRYRQLSRTVVGGRRDAQNALAELVSSVAFDGKSSTSSAVTVADLLAMWLDHVEDRLCRVVHPTWPPSTSTCRGLPPRSREHPGHPLVSCV